MRFDVTIRNRNSGNTRVERSASYSFMLYLRRVYGGAIVSVVPVAHGTPTLFSKFSPLHRRKVGVN